MYTSNHFVVHVRLRKKVHTINVSKIVTFTVPVLIDSQLAKLKRIFLSCHCLEICRVQEVGLKVQILL